MARLDNSVLGSFSGRIGPVVGSSWKGIPYMKSVYKKRTKKISGKEKANRQKFKLAHEWLQYLVDFVRQGFKGYSPTVEGFLAAKSYLLKNAMERVGSGWEVNPALMKVSVGILPLSENITVKPFAGGMLHFTWDTAVKNGYNDDQVMLLAYNIKKQYVQHTIAGAFRQTGSTDLQTFCKKGDSCHVWIAFVSANRSKQSDSVYLGEIEF